MCKQNFLRALTLALLTISFSVFGADKTEDRVIAELASPSETKVIDALMTLEKKYPTSTQAFPTIKKLLKDPRQKVRRKAARVLGVLHAEVDQENIKDICALLKGSEPREVMDGLIALRGLKAQAIVPEILPFLKHANSNVIRDTCRTLAVLGNKNLIPSIQPLLNHSDESVKQDARDAISKLAAVSLKEQPPKPETVSARERKSVIGAAATERLSERPTKPEQLLWQPEGRRQAWALIVGIGQYKSDLVPPLPFAKADGGRIREWFQKLEGRNLSRDNVHVLFDEQATRENFLQQVDWLRRQAMPEDAVFIYFASHGAPELAPDGKSVDAKYLLLYDTDPNQLFATGFSLDDLTRKLEAVKAKAQVVILEACYTGPMGQEILKKTPTADLEIRPRLIQDMGERGGRVILSASSGRQVAIGSDEIKGGLFTHYLLNAWGDGSRRLLTDCFEDAREQVRRAANRLGSAQDPARFGDQNLDVILKMK